MSESNQQNLDRMIREAMDEKIKDCPEPKLSAAEAWERMERVRNKGSYFHRKRRLPKIAIWAIVVLFILFILASNPQKGVAFNRWSELFTHAQGSVVQLFGNSGAEPAFYVMEDPSPIAVEMSLDEAKSMTNFIISIPTVPTGFQLEHVTVMEETDGGSNEVYLHYTSSEREFTISERAWEEQFSFGMTVDRSDLSVEELNLNGQRVSLTTFKNGIRKLTWKTQSHFLQVEGELTEDEIVRIAESM